MKKALVAAALLLSACSSSVPMASSSDDTDGKRFQAPAPNMAVLYIYRGAAGLGGGEAVFTPTIGQRMLGGLAPRTWFRVELAPGQYDLRCLGGENQGNLVVTLASQETRFVEIEPGSGWVNYRCHLIEVDANRGRDGVLRGSRAAALN